MELKISEEMKTKKETGMYKGDNLSMTGVIENMFLSGPRFVDIAKILKTNISHESVAWSIKFYPGMTLCLDAPSTLSASSINSQGKHGSQIWAISEVG